jgi:hypothetical protein
MLTALNLTKKQAVIFYLPWDEETLSPLQNAESVDDSTACCSNNLWV